MEWLDSGCWFDAFYMLDNMQCCSGCMISEALFKQTHDQHKEHGSWRILTWYPL